MVTICLLIAEPGLLPAPPPARTACAGEAGRTLAERAALVLPNVGHLDIALMPPGYSQYWARGSGCRLVDVDGKVSATVLTFLLFQLLAQLLVQSTLS